MPEKIMLSVTELSKQLNTGKATTKFLLKRFEKWIPCEYINGQACYDKSVIKKLFLIQEQLDADELPGDIEKKLDTMPDQNDSESSLDNLLEGSAGKLQNGDIHLSSDGLNLLKSLFQDIGVQQQRIAQAHEKRAAAEERKAAAIEKRALAEEKKAEAIISIANALQEMNRIRHQDVSQARITRKAAGAVTAAEAAIENDGDLSQILEDIPGDRLQNIENCPEEQTDIRPEPAPALNNDLDDLSALISQDDIPEDFSGKQVDDLSSPAGPQPGAEEQKTPEPEDKIDDLSLLLDTTDEEQVDRRITSDGKTLKSDDIDDLSALINEKNNSRETPKDSIDDLSMLLDPQPEDKEAKAGDKTDDMDDLSLLIDDVSVNDKDQKPETEGQKTVDTDIDDLSQLIGLGQESVPAAKEIPMDDLSKLIDDANDNPEPSPGSASREKPDETTEIKIEVDPEKDFGKYKAAVMQVIIGLKQNGLNSQEATERLNRNQIRTLSGKPEWGEKAISQIYKFIESAK